MVESGISFWYDETRTELTSKGGFQMKKNVLKLVALVVLVCLLPVCALALEPVKITSMNDNGDGTVTITWDNPNNGVVTVGSLAMSGLDAGNAIVPDFDITGNTYTFKNLAPGLEYGLVVMPEVELDYADLQFIEVADVPEFDDFHFVVKDANLTHFLPTESSYSYNYANDLSNEKIYDLLDERQFWVKIDFSHLSHRNSFTVPVLTVVTSPTGYVETDADEIEITANCIGFWRTMVYMNGALEAMYETSGEIPTGEYNVKVYLDGAFAGESSFVVKD